jgi:hypothetical protein
MAKPNHTALTLSISVACRGPFQPRSAGLRQGANPSLKTVLTNKAADVERAAESMDVLVSGEAIQAILAAIDSDLPTLAADATHSAVLGRIFNELETVSLARGSGRGHPIHPSHRGGSTVCRGRHEPQLRRRAVRRP